MTDQAAVQDSLMVTVDDDGTIVTFETPRLMSSNPRVGVSGDQIMVLDDDGILVEATGVSHDATLALRSTATASLVGIYAGEEGDTFDVRAQCPVGKLEDVQS